MADVTLTEDARVDGVLAAREGESVPKDVADKNGWAYKGAKAPKDTDE